MHIYDLPPKSEIDYIYAQYFRNGQCAGLAHNVIKIQYQTHSGFKSSFIIPITGDTRNINRKAKNILGSNGAAIKQKAKKLKKEKTERLFGFRMETNTWEHEEHTYYRRKSDGSTQCWAYPNASGMNIELLWAGETIKISLDNLLHKTAMKQSKAIGFYNISAAEMVIRKNNAIAKMYEEYDMFGDDTDIGDINFEDDSLDLVQQNKVESNSTVNARKMKPTVTANITNNTLDLVNPRIQEVERPDWLAYEF